MSLPSGVCEKAAHYFIKSPFVRARSSREALCVDPIAPNKAVIRHFVIHKQSKERSHTAMQQPERAYISLTSSRRDEIFIYFYVRERAR
jgi:hypothetical protein